MKKTRNFIHNLFLNQANRKLVLFGFMSLFIMVIFYSCSSEDESINKLGTEKNATITKSGYLKKIDELGVIRPNYITDNVNLFSVEIFSDFKTLDAELNKNKYVGFNAATMQMLNSAKTENDLKIVFEKAGIANSQKIIDILKNIVSSQEQFILENPDFYNLTVEQQTELLNTSVNNYVNSNPITPGGLQGADPCAKNFNKTINRCNSDFGTCAVFAVAGAYAGLAPGLLAAAYCMTTKLVCDGRAKDDYKECINEQVFPDGTPPVTGILTLHCDLDSCWTTDSNGKFVGRTL